jgi:outer membrane murein-binding lipoprotein Lpp
MEDANGYLKKLYEDKINQLESSVKDLNGELQRLKVTLEQANKDL